MFVFRACFLILLFMTLMLPLAKNSQAADATGFNPVPIIVVSKNTGGGVPVGSIIAWPSSGSPADATKWLECNGQSTAGYPELTAIVGGAVPDYRGLFLRGVGSQASYHYGAVTHSSAGLGQIQGDSIREIQGNIGYGVDNPKARVSDGAFAVTIGTGNETGEGEQRSGIVSSFYASRVTPVTNEIRPANKAVRYLIRAVK